MSKKQKKSEKQLFCVTTYSSFRHHYLVEADDEMAAKAYVEEALSEGDVEPIEWQQKHLGEVVADARLVARIEAQHQHQKHTSEGCPWLPLSSVIMREGDS